MATKQQTTVRMKNSGSQKARPKKRHSKHPEQEIREAGVQTSAGIERGRTYSEVSKIKRKNFSSFGSE